MTMTISRTVRSFIADALILAAFALVARAGELNGDFFQFAFDVNHNGRGD